MKNFTLPASQSYLRLFWRIIICALWLLCIASAAFSRDKRLPVLGQQPAPQTVCDGGTPVFTIGAVTGTSGTVTIQWQVSVNGGGVFSNVNGANQNIFSIPNATTGLNGNMYRCVVTDVTGATHFQCGIAYCACHAGRIIGHQW